MQFSHGERLFVALKTAVSFPSVRKFMLWPLVVAGVEAAHHSIYEKDWVEEQLALLSKDAGSSSPLKAITVLKAFWIKERGSWDDCFDVPNAFIS